jgi:hypothetical protein
MNKKIIRVILVALLLLALGCFMSTCYGDWSISTALTSIESKNNATLDSKTTSIMGAAVGIVKIVAAGIAVVMLLVLAMKYMMAAPSDRAEIKKHAVVYVAGAAIMFGVAAVLQFIQDLTTTLGE